jgi:siderophore synthetase component
VSRLPFRPSATQARRAADPVTLEKVRRWARDRGISRARFAQAYDDAFLVGVSRLLEAIYREGYASYSALRPNAAGQWTLDLGRPPTLRAPVSGPLPFRRLEVTSSPWTTVAGRRRTVRTPQAFLNALRPCLKASEIIRHFDPLVADFNNSFANLVLNRLLGQRLDAEAQAIEPVYQGHHYYPFPALRMGPSLAHVVDCSNLCREAIDLPLVAVQPCRFNSADFDDHRACFRTWAGLSLPSAADVVVIPLHPWQHKLSPIVGQMLERGWIVILDDRLKAVPLASQRTCRIVATGFDVKLPIDVTLTAEHRLLYPLNRANAPAVSALARILLETSGEDTLDFQYDLASMAHADPRVETHVSAIVRSPVPQCAGEVVIPALNLWSGPHLARTLLNLHRPEHAYEFFRAYCRVLMRGPVDFYTRWGMAFEPHLQNVYVAIRDGTPSRIILRDLDGTILDPVRIRPVLRAKHLRLAPTTWQHMPSFEIGGQRLAHAMLYGHLGEVMSYLARTARADLARLGAGLDDSWSELIAAAPSPSIRRWVRDLREQSNAVKPMLRMRLARSMRIALGVSRP